MNDFKNENMVIAHAILPTNDRARNVLSVHEGQSQELIEIRFFKFCQLKKTLTLVDEEHNASYKIGYVSEILTKYKGL